MTRDEFNNYLGSYQKSAGEFTRDEILEICSVHKYCLARKDKNWKELNEQLGNFLSNGERYKKDNYYLQDWFKNQDYGVPRFLNDEKNEPIDAFKEIEKKKGELYKEQQKNRDIYNTYRATLRNDARIESLKDAIKSTVDSLNKLPTFEFEKRKCDKEVEAVLLFSDLHIGVNCDNFYNKYNTIIAKERLEKLANDTIEYCKLFKVYRLSVIDVVDAISGSIHLASRINQQCDVIDQVMIAGEYIAQFLNYLAQSGIIVTYRSVSDNHARVTANYKEHIETENFNRLILWYLKERLKDTKVEFIDDNLDYSIGNFKLHDKNIVYVHGHLDNINTVFQNFVGATKSFVDYVLLGHYHSPKQKVYQNCNVIVNGSIVGTDEYALSKRLFTEPSQKLLIFDRDCLVDIDIRLKGE